MPRKKKTVEEPKKEEKKPQLKFGTPARILETKFDIALIWSQRGNGKTYGVLKECLQEYGDHKKKGIPGKIAYVRRMDEDLKTTKGIQNLFDGIAENGEIEKITGGEGTSAVFRNKSFYLSRYNQEKKVVERDEEEFCSCLAINQSHHYRGSQGPGIQNLVFDEFIPETEEGYLVDEFSKFTNLCHTVKRHKTDFKIWLLGNTINKYNIYWSSFGLTNAKTQKQGTIDIYKPIDEKTGEIDNEGTTIACEYCEYMADSENANYFKAFKTESLDMILKGGFQAKYAPPKPCEFEDEDIQFMYFIQFDDEMLQAEIVQKDGNIFTYIHRKTGKIKHPDEDLFFNQDGSEKRNYRRNILKPYDKIGQKIKGFFVADKVFYQDNYVGQMIKNYLKWCEG